MFDGRVWNFSKLNHSEFCLDVWLLNQEIKITKSLNDEVEILDEEDEFEDIEEITSVENSSKELVRFADKINDLIKNQKKIIDKLNKE